MLAYTRARSVAARCRHAVAITLVVLVAGSCGGTTFLEVEDPDIVNPSDVQSQAGANAVRLGALARLNTATSGGESLFLLGGLFADEWINGDSFIGRQEIDERVITVQNSFLTDANRALHRARLSATQAVKLLQDWDPTGSVALRAEMYFVQAYIENLMAEDYCSGLVFSNIVNGIEVYGAPMTTTAAFTRALAHADSGLTMITGSTTDDVRVRNALKVIKGRILLNLNQPAEAAVAVNGVPTNFQYLELHSATTNSNSIWTFNNSAWRYSVSDNEGVNGLNFASAADPRVPVCKGGDNTCKANGVTRTSRDDQTQPLNVQLVFPARETSVAITSGIEARMIEAEAQLAAGNPTASLGTLNAARGTITALGQLADAGTQAARVTQLFRERAFWFFSRGYRLGDMRRLVRQYSRDPNTIFPVGLWHKGGNYGADVNLPVPQAEQNNPNLSGSAQTCIDRNP